MDQYVPDGAPDEQRDAPGLAQAIVDFDPVLPVAAWVKAEEAGDGAGLWQGIFLRSYAQKNPKQEYKRESFKLFSAMLDRIKFDTITTVSKIQVRSQAKIEREELERQQTLDRALQIGHAEAVSPIQAMPGPDDFSPRN